MFPQVSFAEWILPNCTHDHHPFPRLVSRLFYDCDQGQADPVVAIARDQSAVYLQLLMHETQPPSQLTVSTITRCLLSHVSELSFFCRTKTDRLESRDVVPFTPASFLFRRTYRGFNLSNTVADVTLENNLSRVITAVSRALTSSTSRAVTVSPPTRLYFHLLCEKRIFFAFFHDIVCVCV